MALPFVLAACSRTHSVPTGKVESLPPPPPPAAVPMREEAAPELVERAQRLLLELGYQPGPADGVEGERTEAAVRAFQDQEGTDVDGRVSEDLVSALNRAGQLHRVTQVQRRLAALGYDPGEADGQAGPQTRRAIKAFEEDVGVQPRGKVTPDLFERIAKAEAEQVEWASDSGGESAPREEKSVTAAPSKSADAAEPNASELGKVAPAAGTSETEQLAARPEAEVGTPMPSSASLSPSQQTATVGPDSDPNKIIKPGDTVRLRIGRDQVETLDFTVGLDGTILLPDGVSIQAEGLTSKELEDLVMVKLVEVYLMGLQVDVVSPGEASPVKASESADHNDARTEPATN